MRLLLAFLLMPAFLLAQAQNEYINSTSKWHELASGFEGSVVRSHKIIYITGDTVVDGKTLFTISMLQRDSSFSPWVGFTSTRVWNFELGGIRIEDKKLYYSRDLEDSGMLKYDFGLEVGDTISPTGACYGGGPIYIDQIDTFQFGNELRKYFIPNPGGGFTYYEGIGSYTGLFGPPCVTIEGGQELVCYEKDGVVFSPESQIECMLGNPEEYCYCPSEALSFCGTVEEGDYLVLGEVLENFTGRQSIKIIEVPMGTIDGDTLMVQGLNGINCRDFIGAVGDTVLFHLVVNQYGDYEDEGCGIHQLHYANDSLYGEITPELSVLAYEDFINQIEDCIGVAPFYQAGGRIRHWKGYYLDQLSFDVNSPGNLSGISWNGYYETDYAIYNEATDAALVSLANNWNPTDGISALDLVRIQRHLLGVQPFNSPYQYIAADVNGSESVTIFDIVQIQQVLLGNQSGFSVGKSWEFIDASYSFPNPDNPWQEPYRTSRTNYVGLDYAEWERFDFTAVKLGDVTQPS